MPDITYKEMSKNEVINQNGNKQDIFKSNKCDFRQRQSFDSALSENRRSAYEALENPLDNKTIAAYVAEHAKKSRLNLLHGTAGEPMGCDNSRYECPSYLNLLGEEDDEETAEDMESGYGSDSELGDEVTEESGSGVGTFRLSLIISVIISRFHKLYIRICAEAKNSKTRCDSQETLKTKSEISRNGYNVHSDSTGCRPKFWNEDAEQAARRGNSNCTEIYPGKAEDTESGFGSDSKSRDEVAENIGGSVETSRASLTTSNVTTDGRKLKIGILLLVVLLVTSHLHESCSKNNKIKCRQQEILKTKSEISHNSYRPTDNNSGSAKSNLCTEDAEQATCCSGDSKNCSKTDSCKAFEARDEDHGCRGSRTDNTCTEESGTLEINNNSVSSEVGISDTDPETAEETDVTTCKDSSQEHSTVRLMANEENNPEAVDMVMNTTWTTTVVCFPIPLLFMPPEVA